MSTPEIMSDYRAARERYAAAAVELEEQLVRMALTTLAEVLPGAETIDAVGSCDGDLIPTLRIQRVRSVEGEVLFDVDRGHPTHAVEDAVDRVDIEYLDVLIGIAADRYMGAVTIARSAPPEQL